MTIDTEVISKTTVALKLSGRLDTANSPLLEQKINHWGDEVTTLVLDFKDLEYISSIGLRVLLHAKKTLKDKNRDLIIKNMAEAVREVFELTGFINLIVREEGFAVVRKDEPGKIVLYLNGELTTEGVPTISEELIKIKKHESEKCTPITIILDMEKLYCILPNALKHLRQAIADSVWVGRALLVRNVPVEYSSEMEAEGLGELAKEE